MNESRGSEGYSSARLSSVTPKLATRAHASRRLWLPCLLALSGLALCFAAQNLSAYLDTAQDDPCGLTRTPVPLILEAAQLKTQAKDAEYRNALLEWMSAANDLSEAETDHQAASGSILLGKMQAKRDRDSMVRQSNNLSAKIRKLAGVCMKLTELRVALTSDERTRMHAISILRASAKMLRARVAPERIRAEADRYVAEANDVKANRKRVSGKLDKSILERDRLKGLVRSR